jgi:hypothetical protein
LYQFPDAAYPAAAATAASSSFVVVVVVVVSSLLVDHDESLGEYNPSRIHHEEQNYDSFQLKSQLERILVLKFGN